MNEQTEKLRKEMAESLGNNILKQGWKLVGFERDIWAKSHVFADQILKACKEAGLKFVDSKEMDSWDTLWIKEIEF